MSATIMMRQNHAAGSRRRGFLDTHPCSPFVLLYHHDSRVARMPHTWNEMDEVDQNRYVAKIALKFRPPIDIFQLFLTRRCKARRRRLRECRGQDANVFGVASTPRVTMRATHVAVVRSHLSWSHLLFPAA
ncbi:hypothetical protein ALC56_14826 [Trachymyrmex septentrionalis]|uniref:Uncharacterized protein n=1 Tax=Trachymyrmex septentrionalis TaxID=34720 RepID=A0A195ET04_9HYME|nr:hypothetical protein ALC56_14826 [Trachymyrmex septentrionalis]